MSSEGQTMSSMFGDSRLDRRLDHLTEQLSAIPMANLPQTLTKWAELKAGYRFVNNPNVSHAGIIEVERRATVQRAAAISGEVILAVQDTTAFNFADRAALEGLGVLDDNHTPGFFAHTTLAVSEQGVPLGLLEQQVWSRSPNPHRVRNAHQAKPITEKESFKWLAGLPQANFSAQPVVTICDREADIYELFQEAHNRAVDFVVRAVRNRRLEDADLLHDQLRTLSPSARYELTVQRQRDQAERQATVELRYTTVTLLPPKNRPKQTEVIPLQPLAVQVVEVREVNAAPEVKDPLQWMLLTTLPVTDLDAAYRIVRFYTYRWVVERFHYVLKSGGCHFEDSQLRTVEALQRLLGVCSRVAWRLLWLTYQARQTPQAPCTVALSEPEWHALTVFVNQSQTPAPHPPSLQEAVRAIAHLGGFIGRKSDGNPGVKTLWRGWQRLQDIVATWLLFHPSPDVGND
jgi:hypothetical protein